MRLIAWNPQNFSSVQRREAISNELANIYVCILPGTMNRGYDNDVKIFDLPEHIEFRFGWQPGKYTNKSAGISILLSKRVFSRQDIRTCSTPCKDLLGRGGKVRVKNKKFDLTIIGAYFPPKGCGGSNNYSKAVHKLTDELEKWCSDIPSRSTPLMFADLNDHLGTATAADELHRTDNFENIGNYMSGVENLAGSQFRKLLGSAG
jgi:hypothetical protein